MPFSERIIGRGRRANLVSVVAVVVVSVWAVQAGDARAASAFSSSQRGLSANAYWEDCTTTKGMTTCTVTSLFAFQGTEKGTETAFKGTRVCVSLETYSFRERGRRRSGGETSSSESGCATAPTGTLNVSRDLSAAILQPTSIAVEAYDCMFDETTGDHDCVTVSNRDVTVSATWTASGTLTQSSERSRFKDGECQFAYSARGGSRDAIASGTLDGASLGDSHFAGLSRGRFTFKSTCALQY